MEPPQTEIKLHKWNPKMILEKCFAYTASIIGNKCTGKTILINDLLVKTQRKNIYIFSNKIDCNILNRENYPDAQFYNGFNNEVVNDLIAIQKKSEIKQPITIVLDEVMVSKEYNSITDIIFCGRFYNITLIISIQENSGLSSLYKSHLDLIFLLKSHVTESQQRKLFIDFFIIGRTFEQYKSLYEKFVENKPYSMLVLDQTITSIKIEDNLFYYNVPSVSIRKN